MVQERLNEFYDKSMDLEYRDKWSQKAIELIADAYALNVSVDWVEYQLDKCNHQEIHKVLILKCRDRLDFWDVDENDIEVIKDIMKKHKRELYTILTNDIYNYCVR